MKQSRRMLSLFLLSGVLAAALPAANALAGRPFLFDDAGAGGSRGNPRVIPPTVPVFGRTYAEWGAAWWQWALSGTCAANVFSDPDGQFIGLNQSGHVFFLAGGVPTTRSASIPSGSYLFFPLINVINDYPCPPGFGFEPDPGQSLEDFLTNGGTAFPGGARGIIDPTTVLQCEVDGHSLSNLFDYRATSHLFHFTGNADLANCFDPCITGTDQVAVTDGFWLMLAPLSNGRHAIHFFASGLFTQEETYNLTVGSGMSATAEGPTGATGRIAATGRAGSAGLTRLIGKAGPTGQSHFSHTTWGAIKTIYR